jgi:hypothetical protein
MKRSDVIVLLIIISETFFLKRCDAWVKHCNASFNHCSPRPTLLESMNHYNGWLNHCNSYQNFIHWWLLEEASGHSSSEASRKCHWKMMSSDHMYILQKFLSVDGGTKQVIWIKNKRYNGYVNHYNALHFLYSGPTRQDLFSSLTLHWLLL